VSAQHPEIVAKLKGEYEAWFKDVSSTRPDNYAPPAIIVGSQHEKTTVLTRQDWRGAGWAPTDEGHWLIDVVADSPRDIKIIAAPADAQRKLTLRIGSLEATFTLPAKATEHVFARQLLPTGKQKLEAWLETDGQRTGVRFVEIAAPR